MKRSTDPKHFLTAEESAGVSQTVCEVESRTSAEVKLLIVRHCWGDIHRKAASLFHKHGLDKTALRNAVMIMLVTTNREFLIYGDQGIHERVGEGYWVVVRDELIKGFKAGRVGSALCEAIRDIGRKLVEHFPASENDVNEIPDGVAHDE